MTFDDPAEVEQLTFSMKTADYPRAQNRARINELFNGFPPYSPTEVAANNIAINVNFLEGTGLAHEARSQFTGAFLKPGRYFNCSTDFGVVHKRRERGAIVTKEINRIMKRSLPYFECFRSKFALDVLHGIGPSVFKDDERWCPQPIGIEDIMIPANTLLTLENVPFFAIYRSYTAPELMRLTRGPNVDPAWNLELVESILEWVDRETLALMGSNWPEVWSPEKTSERVKGDGGFYSSDSAPTVDVWDLYYWNDDKKQAGWNRRMILDAWSTPTAMAAPVRRTGGPYDKARQFLYNPKARKFADRMTNIINFQFADLSAVAPFKYHSVRSLGFLLYALCHLQNRMRCRFNEAVFEALLMYFRVKNMDDAQRALKVELANRGFIDETLQFIPAAERWQVNAQLVQLGLGENRGLINRHTSSYVANTDGGRSSDQQEKTRYQVMAEIQQTTALVGAALNQAYHYQGFEYTEIFRRFCRSQSTDPDVREFQARCVKRGVPIKMLSEEQWEIEPERVLGAGNKTLEMTIAEQLMSMRPLYDPSAQRKILRNVTSAITDDPAQAEELVPEEPEVSGSVHDAQLRFGSLMALAPMNIKDGTNHGEVAVTLLGILGQQVIGNEQNGQLPMPKELAGYQNVAQHIQEEIDVIAQDPNEKANVAKYGQALGQITNLIKAQGQRLQEQMKKQQEAAAAGNGQIDPKDVAKVKAMEMQAQVKAKNLSASHAQKTAQRQIQFEMEQKRKVDEHRLKLQEEAEKSGHALASETLATRQELAHNALYTEQELRHEELRASQEAEAGPETAE